MEKTKTVDTVRERERERELHFSNRKCGFIQQPDTQKTSYIRIGKGKIAFIYDTKIQMADYV